MKPNGIELSVGTWGGRLYYDQPQTQDKPKGYGLRVALRWGPWAWACPKFWSKDWDHDHYPTQESTWFVLRGNFVVGLFISLVLGKIAMYIGLKDSGSVLLPSMKLELDRHDFNP